MNEWLKNNGWAIAIAAAALIGNYAIYGYRIGELSTANAANAAAISSLNTQQVQTQIALAQIQVDLTYIKESVDKLSSK